MNIADCIAFTTTIALMASFLHSLSGDTAAILNSFQSRWMT